MVNAQEWLDKKYPNKQEVKEINLLDLINEQESKLIISDFPQLEKIVGREEKKVLRNRIPDTVQIQMVIKDCPQLKMLDVSFTNSKELKISNCPNLEELYCWDNKLTSLDFLTNLVNKQKLIGINIYNNNFSLSSLDIFKPFTSLQCLHIGSDDRQKINQGTYNRFHGSLQYLENLTKLGNLDIRNTDIDSGLEYLPDSVKYFSCSAWDRKNAKCQTIYNLFANDQGEVETENGSIKNLSQKLQDYKQKLLARQKIRVEIAPTIPPQFFNKKEDKLEENYEIKETSYNKIYPSDFPRKVNKNKSLSLEKLPIKLYEVDNELDEELDEAKDNVINTSGKNDIKKYANYAILSYVWGEPGENYRGGLTPWGKKSLIKAVETCNFLDIDYLWMDQLCIDQNNPQEKNQEVPKMRQYYNNATATLIAIQANASDEFKEEFDEEHMLGKVISSEWFKRSWTFQEGWLSKWTLFMFDDKLVDGRAMATTWLLHQPSHSGITFTTKDKVSKKIATPVGWTYYDDGYDLEEDKMSLTLNQALREVKDRGRDIPIDGIYSILGLLPYGEKVKVDYSLKPEEALLEVMKLAVEEGHGEPVAWHGKGSNISKQCWMPSINIINGSSSIEGAIIVNCVPEKITFKPDGSIRVTGSEYVVDHGSNDISKWDQSFSISSGAYRKKIWVTDEEDDENKELELSGTYETLKAIDKKQEGKDIRLLVLNKEHWESETPFAILVERKGKLRHRLGLVEVHKGLEKLKGIKEKSVTIGDNFNFQTEKNTDIFSQYQAQILQPTNQPYNPPSSS